MFPAVRRALSPTSMMMGGTNKDDHQPKHEKPKSPPAASDAESYADTYFREIGFKTGDNSLIGSTESPELDGDGDDDSRLLLVEDVDRSLGLLEDNSLATDVERAVAAAAADDDDDLENNNYSYLYGQQQHQQDSRSSGNSKNNSNGLIMSKAYSTPYHSYFGSFQQEQEEEEEDDAQEIVRPSPRNYNITYPENANDDVSISTLGEESIRRKPSPLYAHQRRAAAAAAAVEAALSNNKKHFAKTTTTTPGRHHHDHHQLDDQHLDLKKIRTGSTLEERPSEDSDDFHHRHLARHSKQQGTSRSSSEKEEEESAAEKLNIKRRWKFIYFIFGTSLILLSTAAVVLGFSIVELKNSENDEASSSSSSSDGTWVPEIPEEWVVKSSSSPPSTATTTENHDWELALQDVLQIIGTVSPQSLSSISDTSTPQYQALDWLVYNPDYFDYSVERVLQRWSMAVLYFSLGGGGSDDWATSTSTAGTTTTTTGTRQLSKSSLSESDPPSTEMVAWLSEDSHECLWYTTDLEDVCDSEGRLVGLHLSDMGLSGSIPPEVSLLSGSLERFYLPFNNITGTIPSEIGDLSHLVRLQLTANQIEGTIPLEIAQLSTLVVLGLGRNQLSGSLPSALGGLKNLTTLGLEGNSFEGTLPTEFGQMVSLEFLTLESNEMKGSIPSEIGNLENLDIFAVHQNHFTGNMPDEICPATNETTLMLSADCSEVDCKCCTLCCIDCEGRHSGVLIESTPEPTAPPTVTPVPTVAPSSAPSTAVDRFKPAISDLQEQVNQMVPTLSPHDKLWPFVIAYGGAMDAPSLIPSDAPSLVPSGTPSAQCVSIDANKSCFETNGGNIEVEFYNCQPTGSDWIGLFKEEKDFSDSSRVGKDAPPADDAELWLRACGNRQCSAPTNSGTVSFGNGRLRMKEGEYRIFFVQQGVAIATSQVFEIRRDCK